MGAVAALTPAVASAGVPAPISDRVPPLQVTYTAPQIAATQESPEEKASSPSVAEYLAKESRRGNNLDLSMVRSSVLPDSTTVVWGVDSQVQAVGVVTTDTDRGLGLITSDSGQTSATVPQGPPGMAMGAFNAVTNGTYQNGTCTTASSFGDTATSCFEKYKINNTTNNRWRWAYNRWGTGDPQGSTHKINEITIRSRPWSGTASDVAALNDYQPRSGGNICTSGGEISVSYAGFGAKLPIDNCDQTDVSPNATAKSMMAQWTGSYTGIAKSAQFMMFLSTYNTDLTMADYIWTNFRYESNGQYNYHPTYWANTGW